MKEKKKKEDLKEKVKKIATKNTDSKEKNLLYYLSLLIDIFKIMLIVENLQNIGIQIIQKF